MRDRATSPKRRLSAMFSVRVTAAELQTIQARAIEQDGGSVSAYLRRVALAAPPTFQIIDGSRLNTGSWDATVSVLRLFAAVSS